MFVVGTQYHKNIVSGKIPNKKNKYFILLLIATLVMTSLGSPAASERILIFRSIEDTSTPPDESFCGTAPFAPNVLLGASLWSIQTQASDAMIVNGQVRRIGNATACTRITWGA